MAKKKPAPKKSGKGKAAAKPSVKAAPAAVAAPPCAVAAGTKEHREKAGGIASVRCAIVTVSDSRTEATDESGKLMRALLEKGGHAVVHYALLKNEPAAVARHVQMLLNAPAHANDPMSEVDAVILTGGTGLGRRDRTVEAVRTLLDREIPGFGELFRLLSYQEQIGTAAILSRALAGGVKGKLVVSLPGSKAAVDLALNRILLPEIRHLVWELKR